jgi:eukaryotic-like serine/threonine-protein kinase
MSPEQLLGETLDTAWDLWALAVVAYQVLTGALPFARAGTDWQRSVIAGKFTPLSEYLTEPPPTWELFFHRSFSTDRSERPRSAAELFDQLERALA